MTYTKVGPWTNGSSPFLSATNLDAIEQGITDAHTTANANAANISTNTTNISTNTSNITTLQSQMTAVQDSAGVDYNTPGSATVSVEDILGERGVSVLEFGAVGDNTTDDAAAFQAAFNHCAQVGQQVTLIIPEGSYYLGSKITATKTFDIVSHKTAALRWDSATDAGLVFDFADSTDTLCHISLPQLFGPAINSNFTIPNYSSGAGWAYDLTSRKQTAVHLKGSNRVDIDIHIANGWENAVQVESLAAHSSAIANVNIRIGTADFNEKCLYLNNSSATARGISQFTFEANTVWAKFPIYIDATNGYCHASHIHIKGGALVNENGGCVIYALGTNLSSSKIKVNWAEAGERDDSVPATTVGLVCPYIGGNQTSNTLSFDGEPQSAIAYFGGKHCVVDIGAAFDSPVADLGAKRPRPLASDATIRVRDAGDGNDITIEHADYDTSGAETPIAVSSTSGEANYNSGVGGAQFAKAVYSSVTLSALGAGASQNFYMYHQLVSSARTKPIVVVPRNEKMQDDQIEITAFQESSTNRQIRLRVKNASASAYTDTVNFYVVVD